MPQTKPGGPPTAEKLKGPVKGPAATEPPKGGKVAKPKAEMTAPPKAPPSPPATARGGEDRKSPPPGGKSAKTEGLPAVLGGPETARTSGGAAMQKKALAPPKTPPAVKEEPAAAPAKAAQVAPKPPPKPKAHAVRREKNVGSSRPVQFASKFMLGPPGGERPGPVPAVPAAAAAQSVAATAPTARKSVARAPIAASIELSRKGPAEVVAVESGVLEGVEEEMEEVAGAAGRARGTKRLNTDWLHASLPLSELRADRGQPGEGVGRLCGSALDREIGSYYVDLGMRDFRLFLAHVLKELGIPYHAAAYRQVPASRLASLLRRLGIPARSELMNAVCDNLVWCEDQFVSFAKLVEMSGDLEIENFGRASDPSAAIEKVRQRVELKRQLEETAYDRERLKIMREREQRAERFHCDPRSALVDSLRRPESFTPTTVGVVATLHEMLLQSKLAPADFISGVLEVTGAPHAERLTALLQRESEGPRRELRLQDVLVAALKDAQDVAASNSAPHRAVFAARKEKPPPPYVSPITHLPMGGELTTTSRLVTEDMQLQAGGMPDEQTLAWFQSVLCRGQKFPQIPLESELKNLKHLAASIASGWITTAHLKQLCDVWDLPLNQHLGAAVRDHAVRGRCSLRTLWKGLVIALEQQGCRV